jgi:hypothetical protein
MSRIGLLLLTAVMFSVGCGYGSHSNYMNGGGMGGPQITQLQPSMVQAGSGPITLTIDGSGFGTDSIVYWNMVAQASSYVSSTQVMAQITAAELMNAGMVPVYVRTGQRNSNTVNFDVQ